MVGPVRNRRADLTWAPLLALSAALCLTELLDLDTDWVPVVMIALAYPAGRRMVSFPLALRVFTAVGFAGLALAFWRSTDPLSDWVVLVSVELVSSVLPWWFGRYRRLRAEQADRERTIVAGQARLRERARIAQDMHDSLGHELALIALHSGALELAEGATDEQRRSAAALRACAVRATGRLHEIVEVLGSTDAAADLRPADETIETLVRRATTAGLRIRFHHDGPPPTWSPRSSRAAHRLVQESLTNATRHAPGAPVTVTLTRRTSDTHIEIVNDPVPRQPDHTRTGQGLIGLDERVRLAGGSLHAGPTSDGRWAVTAVLPDNAGAANEDAHLGFDLGVSRRLTRRGLLQTAMLPLGLALTLLAALAAVQILTGTRTGLPPERYEALLPGQPRTEVERQLPPHDIGREPEIIATPPRPADATCRYYHVGDGLFDLSPDVYQLCFADGTLVAKDRLEMA
jgi:signal transduction histidine kinase